MSSISTGVVDQSAENLALLHDSRLYNKDLAPTTASQRTWGTYNYIALWFSMSMEVTTYMLASSLDRGRHELEAGDPYYPSGESDRPCADASECACGDEVRYSLPCVCARELRYAWSECSSDAACDCGLRMVWDSVVAWRAGDCAMIGVLWPSSAHMPSVLWTSFLGFWLLNMYVVWRGVESIRFLQSFSAPFMLVMSLTLLLLDAA